MGNLAQELLLWAIASALIVISYQIINLTTVIKEKQIILKIETFKYDVTAVPGSNIYIPKE